MKLRTLLFVVLTTGQVFCQSVNFKSIKGNKSRITVNFENVNVDSLVLNHSFSFGDTTYSSQTIQLPKEFNFTAKKGEYHTIWISGIGINKGLWFEGGFDFFDVEISLNLENQDVYNIYWNTDENHYNEELIDYNEMMKLFKNDDYSTKSNLPDREWYNVEGSEEIIYMTSDDLYIVQYLSLMLLEDNVLFKKPSRVTQFEDGLEMLEWAYTTSDGVDLYVTYIKNENSSEISYQIIDE